MDPSPAEVTRLLGEYCRGDRTALERLVPLVYGELRKIAAGALKAEREGHTLQPTALVHEAYMRLADQRDVQWRNRGAHGQTFASDCSQLLSSVGTASLESTPPVEKGKNRGDAESA